MADIRQNTATMLITAKSSAQYN